jgi:hypothetical protein
VKKSIDSRLEDLEKKSRERPVIIVWQDLDNRELYHVGGRDAASMMTWDEIEEKYQDYVVIRVTYADGNRESALL